MEPHSPYILTSSGRKVGPKFGAPSIDDIAIALSRQPRFGGHGRTDNYSVLDHSLFVERLARDYPLINREQYRPRLRLAALLHDAHEAMTADIPSPFKMDGMRTVQHDLDDRIAEALVPELPLLFVRSQHRVATLDKRALFAEALVVGPSILQTVSDVEAHFGTAPFPGDLTELDRMLRQREQWENGNLGEFERLYILLRSQIANLGE